MRIHTQGFAGKEDILVGELQAACGDIKQADGVGLVLCSQPGMFVVSLADLRKVVLAADSARALSRKERAR